MKINFPSLLLYFSLSLTLACSSSSPNQLSESSQGNILAEGSITGNPGQVPYNAPGFPPIGPPPHTNPPPSSGASTAGFGTPPSGWNGQGNTFYVSLSGRLENSNCSILDPCRNIQDAVDIAQDGDRVIIGPGLFKNEPIVVDGKAVTLEGTYQNGAIQTRLYGACDPSEVVELPCDFQLTGVPWSKTAEGIQLKNIHGQTEMEVKNLDIRYFVGSAIKMEFTTAPIRIENNHIELNMGTSIVAANTENLWIGDNFFKNNNVFRWLNGRLVKGQEALSVVDSDTFWIVNNFFQGTFFEMIAVKHGVNFFVGYNEIDSSCGTGIGSWEDMGPGVVIGNTIRNLGYFYADIPNYNYSRIYPAGFPAVQPRPGRLNRCRDVGLPYWRFTPASATEPANYWVTGEGPGLSRSAGDLGGLPPGGIENGKAVGPYLATGNLIINSINNCISEHNFWLSSTPPAGLTSAQAASSGIWDGTYDRNTLVDCNSDPAPWHNNISVYIPEDDKNNFNAIVSNNIVFHRPGQTNPETIGIRSINTTATITNNLFGPNTTARFTTPGTAPIFVNDYSTNLFTNWQAEDFTLSAGSVAIDQGTTISPNQNVNSFLINFTGTAPDIGYDEF